MKSRKQIENDFTIYPYEHQEWILLQVLLDIKEKIDVLLEHFDGSKQETNKNP